MPPLYHPCPNRWKIASGSISAIPKTWEHGWESERLSCNICCKVHLGQCAPVSSTSPGCCLDLFVLIHHHQPQIYCQSIWNPTLWGSLCCWVDRSSLFLFYVHLYRFGVEQADGRPDRHPTQTSGQWYFFSFFQLFSDVLFSCSSTPLVPFWWLNPSLLVPLLHPLRRSAVPGIPVVGNRMILLSQQYLPLSPILHRNMYHMKDGFSILSRLPTFWRAVLSCCTMLIRMRSWHGGDMCLNRTWFIHFGIQYSVWFCANSLLFPSHFNLLHCLLTGVLLFLCIIQKRFSGVAVTVSKRSHYVCFHRLTFNSSAFCVCFYLPYVC